MTADDFNALDGEELVALLCAAGATPQWSHAVIAARPFADAAALRRAQEQAWAALDDAGWQQALEQASIRDVPAGDDATRAAAALALDLYASLFGFPFVASGRTDVADELLMRTRIRLGNDDETEQRIARDECRRVIRQRLEQQAAPVPT